MGESSKTKKPPTDTPDFHGGARPSRPPAPPPSAPKRPGPKKSYKNARAEVQKVFKRDIRLKDRDDDLTPAEIKIIEESTKYGYGEV
jgi:hypothetical protein